MARLLLAQLLSAPVQRAHNCTLLPIEVVTCDSLVSVTETEQKKAGFPENCPFVKGWITRQTDRIAARLSRPQLREDFVNNSIDYHIARIVGDGARSTGVRLHEIKTR